jgi:hypothetical protein
MSAMSWLLGIEVVDAFLLLGFEAVFQPCRRILSCVVVVAAKFRGSPANGKSEAIESPNLPRQLPLIHQNLKHREMSLISFQPINN